MARPEQGNPVEAPYATIASIFLGTSRNLAILHTRATIAENMQSVAAHMAVLESRVLDIMTSGLVDRIGISLEDSPLPDIHAGAILSCGYWFRLKLLADSAWKCSIGRVSELLFAHAGAVVAAADLNE